MDNSNEQTMVDSQVSDLNTLSVPQVPSSIMSDRAPVRMHLRRSDFIDTPYLPEFIVHEDSSTTIGYNGRDMNSFCQFISSVYEDVKCWKKNLFTIPSGDASKKFIRLLSY